ncbi:MAG: IPT/TIG domain-containing protein [Candidatus Ornithobacterium hominis]|nr:IPT/TIG domain-containing protein [Candidatus Ornithobacterium hominis]
MRKILSLLTIFVIVSSCSSDDSTEQQQNEFPTNIEITSLSAEIGEIITINGNGFLSNETYTVTFTENQIATITEINNNYLKVEVPENAASGNITLTFNNQTEIIGNIEILNNSVNEIYIFHNSENKLAKIDLTTGNLTYIGNNINYGINTRNAVYHSENNEYIGFENGFTSPSLVRINLDNGSASTVTIPSSFLVNGADFSDLIIDNNNNLYIFHNSENKLAKIDLTTGNLTYIGNNINYGINTRNAVYHSGNNEYIGFENDFTSPSLVRINLDNGSTSTVTIPSSFLVNGADFSDLIITEN